MANVKTGRPFDYIRMPPQQNTNTRELMVLNNINSHDIILFRGGRKLIYWIELTPRCARAEFALSIDFMLSWIGRSLCHHWRNELFAHSTIYIYIYIQTNIWEWLQGFVWEFIYTQLSLLRVNRKCVSANEGRALYMALHCAAWLDDTN